MSKAGACLSVMTIAGIFFCSSDGRAENFLEMIFGHIQAPVESHQNYARPSRRNGHYSYKSDRFASRKHSADGASAGADDSTPSPASMKLSYAEVWGAKTSGPETCCTSARDMIAKVTRGDSTLRRGDAFMTSDGLQVFVGDRNGDTKFVPVEDASQISRALKAQLEALEKSPAAKPVRIAPVKSRAVSAAGSPGNAGSLENPPTQAVKDRLIKSPNGKTIRLVGGYAG
jgi:hypothetical protein